ncbi:MAG: hypothetical protein V1740_05220 [Candidatus Woesearchaeota archaeon]
MPENAKLTRRGFLLKSGSITSLALLLSNCAEERLPLPANLSWPLLRGDLRSKVTFERILHEVKDRGEFNVYRGTVTNVVEDAPSGSISSIILFENNGTELCLQMGAGSYEVTDGVYPKDQNGTGLFDPRGVPLLKMNCQPGDIATAVYWKKDIQLDSSHVPVRAYGNTTRDDYKISDELVRYLAAMPFRDIGVDTVILPPGHPANW